MCGWTQFSSNGRFRTEKGKARPEGGKSQNWAFGAFAQGRQSRHISLCPLVQLAIAYKGQGRPFPISTHTTPLHSPSPHHSLISSLRLAHSPPHPSFCFVFISHIPHTTHHISHTTYRINVRPTTSTRCHLQGGAQDSLQVWKQSALPCLIHDMLVQSD